MKPHSHLAQLNIAQAVAEMDSPQMAGFISRLQQINNLADNTPGFVWRLQSSAGDSTALRVFKDPLMLINISVWKNMSALKNFVYKSLHVELIRDREAWFNKMTPAHQVLWWLPAGDIPTIAEAKSKLDMLQQQGATAQAFTFGKPFNAPRPS